MSLAPEFTRQLLPIYEDPTHYRAEEPVERIKIGLVESLPGTFAVIKELSQYALLVRTANQIGEIIVRFDVDRSMTFKRLREVTNCVIPYFQAMEKRSHSTLLPPHTIRQLLERAPPGSFFVTESASAGYRLSWKMYNRIENTFAIMSSLIIFARSQIYLEAFPENRFDSFDHLKQYYGLTRPIALPNERQQQLIRELEDPDRYLNPSQTRDDAILSILSRDPIGTYLVTKDKQNDYVLHATDFEGPHAWSLRFDAEGRLYIKEHPTTLFNSLIQLIAYVKIPNPKCYGKVGQENIEALEAEAAATEDSPITAASDNLSLQDPAS